jgi:hypothetical protein
MKKNSPSNQQLLFRDRQTAESNHSKLIPPWRNVTCSEHKTQITKNIFDRFEAYTFFGPSHKCVSTLPVYQKAWLPSIYFLLF